VVRGVGGFRTIGLAAGGRVAGGSWVRLCLYRELEFVLYTPATCGPERGQDTAGRMLMFLLICPLLQMPPHSSNSRNAKH